MRIAICDDNNEELLQVNQIINEYFLHYYKEEKNEIYCFENSMKLLSKIEAGKHFDIFILDIIMPDISGIQLATEIRNRDQIAQIIFLTSSSEFAVESYDVNALAYILKPINIDKLITVIEKVYSDISRNKDKYIVIKKNTRLSKVFFHEILYVEVIGKKVYFHQTSGIIVENTGTLFQIETILLKDKRFIKPHRSYIINLDYIKDLLLDSLTTTNGLTIPISRNFYKEIKQIYIDYSFQSKD